MKTFFLAMLTSLAFSAPLSLVAQNPDSEFQQAVDARLVNLDKAQIPTGVLYDRVFTQANLNNFNQGRSDTSFYEHFYQAYYELYHSSYNRSGKPSPDELDKNIQLSNIRGTIPIGFLHYNFNYIDPLAVEKNQLSIQNDQAYDVPGRSTSPYLPRQSFVLAMLNTQTLKPGLNTFKWASEFIQGNTNVQITNLQVDFGNGLTSVSLNVPFSVYLNGSGLNVVRFVAQLNDGRQLITYGNYAMQENQPSVVSRRASTLAENPAPCYGPYEITSTLAFKGYDESIASVGKGQVSIYYRNTELCGQGKRSLNKPILILDGFDPGDVRDAPTLYGDYLKYNNSTANFANDMRAAGYDIVILNSPKYEINNAPRDGGSDYIERNAYVLIKLIQEVNAELQANGITNQLTIIGPSMGGLISRYALAYMESQCLNHNTKLWISFDSPHQGANIPIGDQLILNYLAQKTGGGARKARDAKLGNPAAKQMLIHHFSADSNTPSGAVGFRTQFQQELDRVGFPTKLKRVAIINGSINGTTQPLTACQISNHLRVRTRNWDLGGFIRRLLGVGPPPILEFKVAPAPAFGNTCRVFEGKMGGGFVQQRDATAYPNSSSIDLAPGGTYAVDAEVRDGINDSLHDFLYFGIGSVKISPFGGTLVAESLVGPNIYCFIPSFSALAMNPNGRNFSENLGNRNLVATGETPFQDYFALNANDGHVTLNNEGVGWIVDKITTAPNVNTGLPTITATSNSPQNCGATLQLNAACNGCTGTVSYAWSGPNGFNSSQQNPSINNASSANAGTYTLNVTANGCTAQSQVSVTVNCGGNQPLPNGCYTFKAKHSNLFIQPETTNGGARLRQYAANGQTNQIFNLEWVDNNAYRINSQSASKIVEASGGNTGNGTPVVLGDWSNGNHQKWNVEAWGDGSYKLSTRNAATQLFDIEGTYTTPGAGVHLWAQHGADNQRFFIQSSGCTGTGNPPTGTCTLTKIRLYPRKDCCAGRTVGGQIQYSTTGRNGPWTTAYTLSGEVANAYTEYEFGAVASVKAVRYLSPDGGYGNVAEIEFYNGATKLTGPLFDDDGGPWGGDQNRVAAKAVDGDVNTFYDSQNCCGAFVGLELTTCSGGGCSAPVPSISGGGNVCNGATVTLTASGCSGTYHWSNNVNGTASITVGAGTYSVTCEQGGCTSASSAAVTVTANCGGSGGCVVNRVRFKFRNVGDCCMDRLQGAKIQGSNDQSTWADLHTFNENGTGDWQDKTFGNTTSYQHVRFVAGPNGYGELYELEFYNSATRLTGTAFGTSGVDGSTGYGSAFDGNLGTWWHAVFPGTNNYAGLHLSGCGSGARASAGEAAEPEGLWLVPNPASEYVELRLPTGEQVRRAVCYDVQGRALIETSHARLYTGRLAGGTYLVRVETKAGRSYSRVLVKL